MPSASEVVRYAHSEVLLDSLEVKCFLIGSIFLIWLMKSEVVRYAHSEVLLDSLAK